MMKILLIICLAVIYIQVSAQKNDTVYLMNGDKITGEFKKFDYGTLTLSTDGLGTINIEYDKIKSAYSGKFFEIVDRTGFSTFGSIGRSSEPGTIDIVVSNGIVSRPIIEIVQMIPIKNKFWKRFYGSVDLGASYYKSTDIFQYNFSTNINHRSRKRLISFDMVSIYTDQHAGDTSIITRKNDVSFDYMRFFEGKWWVGGGARAQQNTELDLDYRLQAGFVGGYDLVHTNPVKFYAVVGVLANKEKPFDTTTISSNLEGFFSLQFSWLQHRHPKVDISSGFSFYPGLTINGRYRLEYDLSVKYEIISDLYLGFTFYDNYDNKPTGGESALNDWGTTIAVGYSF
ncbi:MAG: DUF481 domain-containing protein [Bacteroidales bacterium]|jgi:hypothetical protein|nr:DUF481 domain-containing protein [Bacteroidales bacterium]